MFNIGQLFTYDAKLKEHILVDNNNDVTCADFYEKSGLLAVGQRDGSFSIFDVPDLNLIHTLTMSNSQENLEAVGSVTSIVFNKSGEWLAIGGNQRGILMVWEWSSESFVLSQ